MRSTKTTIVADKRSLKAALKGRARKKLGKPKPVGPPADVIATYYAALAKRFKTIVEGRVRMQLIPMLLEEGRKQPREDADKPKTAVAARGTTRTKGRIPTPTDSRLGTIIGRTRVAWGDIRSITPIAEQASARTAKKTGDVFRQSMRTVLGIQPEIAEPWLAPRMTKWVKENVDLIVTIPETYFEDIGEHVREGFRQGLRHEEIAKTVEAEYLDNGESAAQAKRRAALVARDQVQKLSGDLAAKRQTQLGIKKYVWRSAGDQRVRLTHRARDGVSFTWDALGPQLKAHGLAEDKIDGHPGRPINCRCTAEPDINSLLDELGADDGSGDE